MTSVYSEVHRTAAERGESLLLSSRNLKQRCYKSRLGLTISYKTYFTGQQSYCVLQTVHDGVVRQCLVQPFI